MESVYERRFAEQSAAATQLRGGSAKLRRRPIGKLFQMAWPRDTAKIMGQIANQSHRTAERWLSGEFEAPFCVITAAINELNRLQ